VGKSGDMKKPLARLSPSVCCWGLTLTPTATGFSDVPLMFNLSQQTGENPNASRLWFIVDVCRREHKRKMDYITFRFGVD